MASQSYSVVALITHQIVYDTMPSQCKPYSLSFWCRVILDNSIWLLYRVSEFYDIFIFRHPMLRAYIFRDSENKKEYWSDCKFSSSEVARRVLSTIEVRDVDKSI